MSEIVIRVAEDADKSAIWRIMEPIIRKGETYAFDLNWSEEDAISYWFLSNHHVFVAMDGEEILGTYYLCNNQKGNGYHVANCGFMVGQNSYGENIDYFW